MTFEELASNSTIYLVMNEGAVYLATDDEEYANATLAKLEESNIKFIEDEYDLSEEESPLAVGYLAGREGDHVYLDIIPEGLFYFSEDRDEFETCEGDIVTQSDIELNYLSPEEAD